jgi:large subunit ribosomal protein L4
MIVIDKLDTATHKTKQMADILKNLKIASEKILLIASQPHVNLLRSGRNIRNLNIARVEDINAYDVLVSGKLLFEESAVGKIEKRLSAHSSPDRPKRGAGKKVA